MSDLSAHLLRHAVDWPELARRRRTNYVFLTAALRPIALLPDLPAGVVPLGFPVVVPNRDAIRHELFAQNIFPPVHWPVDPAVPAAFTASRRLADRIMTIPCDQRYTPRDLERVVACLRRAGIV
jgi:dTDP-4-amino-4,6-dideoxygalactose transaminase